MAELVILRPLLLVGQDLIRLVDLFEFSLCPFVPRIHVGVVLLGQLTVRFFQFFVRGPFGHAQDLVIISFLFWHDITSVSEFRVEREERR